MRKFSGMPCALPVVVAPKVVAQLVRVRVVVDAGRRYHGESARIKAGVQFPGDRKGTQYSGVNDEKGRTKAEPPPPHRWEPEVYAEVSSLEVLTSSFVVLLGGASTCH